MNAYLTIRRRGETLGTGLRRYPDDLVRRLTMTVLDQCHVNRLRALPSVPVHNLSIVLAADQYVSILRVVLEADQRRRWFQRHLWLVRIL